MSQLIVGLVIFASIIAGKLIFKKWFNHLTLYSLIFGGAVFLYELKWLPYIDIVSEAWLVIIFSYLSFVFGILTIISARNVFFENPLHIKRERIYLKLFADDGWTLKYFILILSLISLYSAFELWNNLIKEFGSIPAVFINSKTIYKLNVEGKLDIATPYLFLFGYVGVFFSGIYTAYNKRFTILSFLPLLSIILREIGLAGRAGMLVALAEFVISFILFRHLLNNDIDQKFKFSKKKLILGSLVFIILFTIASSLVRVTRSSESSEDFAGASSELKQTKDNIFISPSVYLYLSSDVGVLSKYLSSNGEKTEIGQNTFLTLYVFISKLGIIKRPNEFQRGYNIPMWTNTGTYLRELHADFGISGILLGPYLLGVIITWLWFLFYEKHSMIVFVLLVYLNIIIGFSFFVIASRVLYWNFSLVLNVLFIPILERTAAIKNTKNKNAT
ncbi:MAG: O-antigen polymerase [Ignavibacteriaceae bacterium]